MKQEKVQKAGKGKRKRYYIRIYGMILAQDIKSRMSYRADFFISMFGMLATNIAGLIAFWLMFYNFPSILGWDYNEILFMYGFSLLALTPVQLFFDNNWNLREHVRTGDFIRYCFRPMNLFFYFMAEVFDIKGLGQLVIGTLTLGYAWQRLELGLSFWLVIKFSIAIFSASLVMIAIMNFAAATAFWITNSAYIMVFSFKLKDYAKYPIIIFNPIFRFVFTFLMPIAFIAYYPSLIFLRPGQIPLLTYFSPLIGIAAFILSYRFWMYGAMSYSGTGS